MESPYAPGTVTLVGAGPGDPGLLTLAGLDAIRGADTVVYDRLVAPEILAMIPKTAKTINVGKQSGHHPIPQDEINVILAEEALQGHQVVRLKGGDPFLFGRGGEELEALSARGIPFRVIPGVTSALAAPAAAGIPVTHRDFCSSVHIITGHVRAGSTLDIPFAQLVQTGGTLVFLMGVTALPQICEGLLQAGMPTTTPAAVIENGTRPNQRKLVATLSTLAEESAAQHIHSPAISIFGSVCSLSSRLEGGEPLRGKAVVVTRPAHLAESLSAPLRRLGVEVLEYPCIRTQPAADATELQAALQHLRDFRWLVFTSPQGPPRFMQQLLAAGMDLRSLGHMHLAAMGPSTAAALHSIGLCVDLIPSEYNSVALAEALCQKAEGPLLLCRSSLATDTLPCILQEGGIPFRDVTCYDTVYCRPEASRTLRLLELTQQGQVPVTFTSASTVRGFVRTLPEGVPPTAFLACCLGEPTRQEAQRHGFPALVAAEATIPALVRLVLQILDGKDDPCEL